MTLEEIEKKQEELHEAFERTKMECYQKYMLMAELSDEYNKLEEEIKKLKGN